jgi:hypothetical protein
MTTLRLAQCELADANAFVAQVHRHHKPVQGHRFSLGATVDGKLVGVAVVGRPVARLVNSRAVVEVSRLATDGTKNACSFLYAAAARAARALGYKKIQTYILATEPGTSLKAAGWVVAAYVKGEAWTRRGAFAGQERRTDQPNGDKTRWEMDL